MIRAMTAISLFLVVLTVATSLAHALELPGKMRLSREQYLAVQAIYYPGFTYAGLAEPLSIVALAVLLLLSHGLAASFWLVALALAAAMLTPPPLLGSRGAGEQSLAEGRGAVGAGAAVLRLEGG
jgi:hypothetical protein